VEWPTATDAAEEAAAAANDEWGRELPRDKDDDDVTTFERPLAGAEAEVVSCVAFNRAIKEDGMLAVACAAGGMRER